MLAADMGGIKPWEMADFTPAETQAIYARAQAMQEEVI